MFQPNPGSISSQGENTMKRSWSAVVSLIVFFIVLTGICRADRVTTTDRQTLEGRIELVTPEGAVHIRLSHGLIVVPKERIKSIVRGRTTFSKRPSTHSATKPETHSAGPAYYVLPIAGEIGVEVKAQYLEKALELTRGRPHILVLYIDSLGGSVSEMEKIISVLAKAKSARPVAYVRRALSAAAVIAIACPEICMSPEASIGSAVPFKIGTDGKPKAVDEKLKSAIRAQFRIAAELGEHSPLIVEGMMDLNLELAVRTKDGKVEVARGRDGKILKRRGEILTLTGKEAVACGLAKGIAAEPADAYRALGLKQWHRAVWGGWLQMTIAAKKARRAEVQLARQQRREEYMKKIAPQVAKIDSALSKIRGNAKVASITRSTLARHYDADVDAVEEEYEDMLATARNYANPVHSERIRKNAKIKRHDKLQRIRARYQSRILALVAKIEALNAEYDRLLRQRNKLLKGAPPR